jgi:hypothetical protein
MQVLYVLMMKVKNSFFINCMFFFPVGGSIFKAFAESALSKERGPTY